MRVDRGWLDCRSACFSFAAFASFTSRVGENDVKVCCRHWLARHKSVLDLSGLHLGAYLVHVSRSRPFPARSWLLDVLDIDVCLSASCGTRIVRLYTFFILYFDPVPIGRRRTKRGRRRRRRSCRRRFSTALFRSALDKGLAFELATHTVADLHQLSNVEAPQALTALSRTHEFDLLQRPHDGPSLTRRLVFLDNCKESSDVALHRINVRPKVCDALVRCRALQEVRWHERVMFRVYTGVYMLVMSLVYIGGMSIRKEGGFERC